MAEGKKRIKPVVEEVPAVETEEKAKETKSEEPKAAEEVAPAQEVPVVEGSQVEERAAEMLQSQQEEKRGVSAKLILIVIIITAVLVAIVSGGVYVYFNSLRGDASEEPVAASPSPEPSATASPSPSPEPTDLDTYKVSVLNGSGAIGAASKVESVLTEAGFVVGDTGNASQFDFEKTVVQAKVEVSESVVDKIKDSLEDGGYVVEIGENLEDSEGQDVVITVGAS